MARVLARLPLNRGQLRFGVYVQRLHGSIRSTSRLSWFDQAG